MIKEFSKFAVCVAAGFILHQTNPLFERIEERGTPVAYPRLGRAVVGALLIRFGDAVYWRFGRSQPEANGDAAVVLVAVGLGVAIGYAVDDWIEQ